MNTSRTARGCRQCRDLIDALTDQITQLESRQNSLKQLNSTLIDNLAPFGNNQSPTTTSTNWKQKYEREVQRSCRLERQLMEMQIESEIDRKSVEKVQRERRKERESVAKLSNLIVASKFQGVGMENNPEIGGRRQTRRSVIGETGNFYGRNQLIVKIVR